MGKNTVYVVVVMLTYTPDVRVFGTLAEAVTYTKNMVKEAGYSDAEMASVDAETRQRTGCRYEWLNVSQRLARLFESHIQ